MKKKLLLILACSACFLSADAQQDYYRTEQYRRDRAASNDRDIEKIKSNTNNAASGDKFKMNQDAIDDFFNSRKKKPVVSNPPRKTESAAPSVTVSSSAAKSTNPNALDYLYGPRIFTDWASAMGYGSWQHLEAPDSDKDVTRYLSGNKLYFHHKADNYHWSFNTLEGANPAVATFSVVYEVLEKDYDKGEVGLVMSLIEPGSTKNAKLIFVINPGLGTYSLKLYSFKTNAWENLGAQQQVKDNNVNMFAGGQSTNKLQMNFFPPVASFYLNGIYTATFKLQDNWKDLSFGGIGLTQGYNVQGSITQIEATLRKK